MWDGPFAGAHVGRFTLWLSRRTWGPGSAGCPPPRFAAMTENHRPWLKGHVFPHGPGGRNPAEVRAPPLGVWRAGSSLCPRLRGPSGHVLIAASHKDTGHCGDLILPESPRRRPHLQMQPHCGAGIRASLYGFGGTLLSRSQMSPGL